MSAQSDSCPFCAIARGDDASAQVICEGASWIAFFPLDPATAGHTLVVPRRHYPDLWSAGPELAAELMEGSLRVGRAINDAMQPEGMNLITSSGEAAEQTVFHLHLHLVPRWKRDGFGRIWPPDKPFAEAAKEDAADRIRRACHPGTGPNRRRSAH
jgi:histidine triad (HIT) family protein